MTGFSYELRKRIFQAYTHQTVEIITSQCLGLQFDFHFQTFSIVLIKIYQTNFKYQVFNLTANWEKTGFLIDFNPDFIVWGPIYRTDKDGGSRLRESCERGFKNRSLKEQFYFD